MRSADTILNIHQTRGAQGLPLERVYKHLFNPELFLLAHGNIGRKAAAPDGTDLQRIHHLIELLKLERYRWTPVRPAGTPKADGPGRPRGLPGWGDKLVQEALRTLLEPYYEQKFSDLSHGFRPGRGCHSALRDIRGKWTGTVWFIAGNGKGCLDNLDHGVLLEILRRDIHDGRLVGLVDGLLQAGYLEDWRYGETLGGTPRGGILGPLLANIYLNELDWFVEDTLIPAYTRGKRRKADARYNTVTSRMHRAGQRGDLDTVRRLRQERRKLTAVAPSDPDFRRLRYVRYADDFLLGFIGPKQEAEAIRQRLGEFLGQKLRLTRLAEKALVLHAGDEKANFLGYELKTARTATYVDANGKRAANGKVSLLMPRKVVQVYRERYSKKGKIHHRADLLAEADYTILQRYQAVLKGVYNYYCMAANVSKRLNFIRWILETSLTKTLAHKHRCSVNEVYRRYHKARPEFHEGTQKILGVVLERPGKEPLVATFGGFPFARVPDGLGVVDFRFQGAWHKGSNRRSEVVQRLVAGECQLCGVKDAALVVHHLRKLADLDRPGRRLKADWEKFQSARRRKTLVVCADCHRDLHAGRYDGPSV